MTQTLDTAPGPYYVTMKKGERVAFLLGPFATHQEALILVDRAALAADDVAPGSWFNSFGTARIKEACTMPGKLNAHMGIAPTYGVTA